MSFTAGVVAVQGDVSEHARAIERAGSARGRDVSVHEIRASGIVPDCDAIVLPGGESTAISRLLEREGIDSELTAHVEAGKPVLGTCAGLIVLSQDAGDERVDTLDVLNVRVERNAFGRQRESFEAPLPVDGLETPFPAVFIRAPVIDEVGPDLDVLATWDGSPVAVRQGAIIGTAFHPELLEDSRIHDMALFDGPVDVV